MEDFCFIRFPQKYHGKSGHVVLEKNANYCVQIFFSISPVKGHLFESLYQHSGPSGVVLNMLKMAHCFLTLRECTFFIPTEYQAAILHLKREHKEEIETLKVYFL